MAFGLSPEAGEPRLSYGSYLKIGELTGLQQLRSEPPRHDELLFIVIHQVYELWFKQLLHELDAVMERLEGGEALGAQRLMRRCTEIQRVLVAQLKVLETMTPNDFLTFRDHLLPASGFQSAQFRLLEFRSGWKHARHLNNYEPGSPERARLEAALDEPTLLDGFYGLLRRRGFELPASAPDADPETDPAREARVRELVRIYQRTEEHYDLYLLAESLVEYDEMFAQWRYLHVLMVERMIGSKLGTGGSAGVAYLRGTVDRKFFPELWEMRTYLSDRSGY